jgi:cobalt-zinc-cadmium efflux system outer membrane protein
MTSAIVDGNNHVGEVIMRYMIWQRLILSFALGTILAFNPAFGASVGTVQSSKPSYTLAEVLALALERNPLVTGAEAVVEQNVGQRITAGAYPNPSITGYGGQGMLRDAGRAGIALGDPPRDQLTEYNMTIGQPLEWPAKRAARQRAAESGLAGAAAGLVETRLNLTADVKIAFYDLLLAQRDVELARQNLRIVEDVQRIVNARVRLGEAPQFEAIKAEVEVLKANQAVTRADNTVRVSRVVLDTLTAASLGMVYEIGGDFAPYPRELKVDALTGRAVAQHPTLLRLAKVIERAERSVEFQRQARVPNVTVNGNYVREIGREAFLAGLSVPTPIWYQRQGEVAEALGAKRKEEADFLRTRNVLLKEINQYFQDALTTANLIDVFEKGLLRQSEEALRIARFSFQQGESPLLVVLDAQRVLREILLDYAQARFDLSVSLARLERAVGGPL